jgi:hypothetical protein
MKYFRSVIFTALNEIVPANKLYIALSNIVSYRTIRGKHEPKFCRDESGKGVKKTDRILNFLSHLFFMTRNALQKKFGKVIMRIVKNENLLQEIVKKAAFAKKGGEPFTAIFDLDSTLFDVSPRISKILQAFAALPNIKTRFKKEAEILSTIQPHSSDYGVRRTLARHGVSMEDTTPEFAELLVSFWKKNFFGNEYLIYDAPYPGAVKYVLDLEKAGAKILYLTGRDVPRMLPGTIQSLRAHGFPLDSKNINLILKPSATERDHDFKKRFFEEMEKSKGEVWFFENEPTNIYLVLETSPHVKIVFVETVHSEAVPVPGDETLRISGFEP